MPTVPPCLILDDFLAPAHHAALLTHALSGEEDFAPTVVWYEEERRQDSTTRLSWKCSTGLGGVDEAFRQAIAGALPQMLDSLGMAPFPLAEPEIELIAHRDGSFFMKHVDTLTEGPRSKVDSDRFISAVYYFHAPERRFTGGELVLYPLMQGTPQVIDPRDNRLAVFPSFMPHEVLPVRCPPDNRFADARFAVNCWIRRARNPQSAAA